MVEKGHVLEPNGNFRQSPYLQESALFLGQGQVFDESSKLLKRLCGVDLSAKQTENLCHYYGAKIEQQMADNETIIVNKVQELHYAMVDAGPPVRELYCEQGKCGAARAGGRKRKWVGFSRQAIIFQ